MNKQAIKFIKTKKALAIGLTASIVATTSAPAFANTTKDKVLAGEDRYKTATAVSNEGWKSAKEVVIVNSSKVADALSATPFATQKDAPILLAKKDTLGEDTKAELARLKAEKVYIIGGENSVSQKVVEELKSMNIAADRIKGEDRYDTSLEVAKAIDKMKNIEEVAVVSGNKGIPDAISVAPAAGDKNMPVILSATDSLGKSEEWIKSQGIKKSYVVGGVVSDKVVNKLPNAEKIAGEDRHETNAKVINKFYSDVEVENVFYAKSGMGNEDHLVDALAVGPLAAKKDSPVVILGSKLHTAQEDVIARKKVKEMVQVGQGINENSKKALKDTQVRETFVVKTVAEFKEALKKVNHHDVIEFRPTSKITEDIVIEGDKLMSVRFFGEYTGNVTVKSSGATVVVDKNADLDKVVVQAPNVSIENNGSIGSFKPADDTVLEGNKPNPPSTGGGGGTVTPPQDTTKPYVSKSNINEKAVVLEFNENINSAVNNISDEISVISNNDAASKTSIEKTAYIKENKLVILFSGQLEENNVIKINANAIKDNSNNKNDEITIKYENSEALELKGMEFKNVPEINKYGEFVNPRTVLNVEQVKDDVYKLKGASLADGFSALSDKVYYDETGRKVNPNITNFNDKDDQIIYIETGAEDSGYDEGKDIVLGRFELYGNVADGSANAGIVNAEFAYAQQNGQLNSLTIPKNPYSGNINVYVVKPDVKPLIDSGLDPKKELKQDEILFETSINVASIKNITDIESLNYSLGKKTENIVGNIIKDDYGTLNSIALKKATDDNVKVTIKGLEIVTYMGKAGEDKPQSSITYTTSNTNHQEILKQFIGARVLDKTSTELSGKINLDGLDIDILEFAKFFKKQNIENEKYPMPEGTEIKYINMIFTLEVKVNGNIETEKVGLIWNPSLKDEQ